MPAENKNTPMATRAMQAGKGPSLSLQRCCFIVVEGPDPGAVFPIQRNRSVVGKSPDCDICLADLTVSRQHFEVLNEGGNYLIKDLGSTNGTELDGARVREAFLRPGALVKAGEVLLRFHTEYDAVHIPPSEKNSFGEMLGGSVTMREIFALLEKVAPSDSTVLLLGETGTGKGSAVAAIHTRSTRKTGPLVTVDCGAVAFNLIESELFGHIKGAFTGATANRQGALERSHGGTLFLDELDDLPLELQPKLLRAIEERVFVPLGASQPIAFDSRVIAASKKDLWMEVSAGRFREDLYYRISVVTVRLPPLRERIEDLPLLYQIFAGEHAATFDQLPHETRERWLNHSWPGNVRELRNAVERSRVLAQTGLASNPVGARRPQANPQLAGALLPNYSLPFKEAKEQLTDAFEREYLRRLLERSPGGIAQAARAAGIDRKYLYSLLEKHGLGGPGRKPNPKTSTED